MNEEIKEIIRKRKEKINLNKSLHIQGYYDEEDELLLDNITNLQQENERLKKQLDCKERLTKIMPEDTEFIILSKADYDRQEKEK